MHICEVMQIASVASEPFHPNRSRRGAEVKAPPEIGPTYKNSGMKQKKKHYANYTVLPSSCHKQVARCAARLIIFFIILSTGIYLRVVERKAERAIHSPPIEVRVLYSVLWPDLFRSRPASASNSCHPVCPILPTTPTFPPPCLTRAFRRSHSTHL
jgi:hypothetical protein